MGYKNTSESISLIVRCEIRCRDIIKASPDMPPKMLACQRSLTKYSHDGLCRHDAGVPDARPDGERDQAPMLFGFPSRGDQIGAQDRIDPAHHLQVIFAFSTVPNPARWPNQPERVDDEEDILRSFSRVLSFMLKLLCRRAMAHNWRQWASERRHIVVVGLQCSTEAAICRVR
jgi:hypothetical protein